jgi:hypothetical protein
LAAQTQRDGKKMKKKMKPEMAGVLSLWGRGSARKEGFVVPPN